MPKVIVALLVTAVAVVLLAGYDTKPPRTVNPNSALKPRPKAAPKPPPGARAAVGPAAITPFSVIQVQVTVQHGKLIGVKTVVLTGDGQWRSSIGGRAKEKSRIVEIWYRPAADSDAKIEAIRSAYKGRYGQESVMRVDGVSCVSF